MPEIYYELRQLHCVFGKYRWNTCCTYDDMDRAIAAFNTIKNKDNYQLVKVTETIVKVGEE